MPQMAPMMWDMLFIFFMIMFIVINIMNYYTQKKSFNIQNKDINKTMQLNWKW
uniref:ATP synthase complex subunit 8 n=1 Tax=Dalsira scabrata TaxID=2021946 RepID=A0A343ISF5_9HEMI|nr:ATP synthase F0 subunit 8 [Dalsira scabrata]AST10180.1 ATP synthase F0 subunit 8 [Dalsira scabrata]